MTYQNIMIDRIRALMEAINCSEQYCPFKDECDSKVDYCEEIIKWLDEQYI